ncbi:MAG: DUF3592 domain-containing protein [Flavobacteriales bacterium]|jgi:hypothetical protein
MENEIPNYLPITIVTVVIVAFLIWRFWTEIQMATKGVQTQGTITNWMSHTEKGKRYFYPMIKYTTQLGVEITYRAEERCEGEPIYPPGTIVSVKYLPSDPKTVKTIYP